MGWKADATQKIDESLRQAVVEKLEAGTFGQKDLQDYFTLFTQVANDLDETRDEVDGFNRKFQFNLGGYGPVYLLIRDQTFEMGQGEVQSPDITLEMEASLAAGIFTGQADATAAYMNGQFKIDGNLPDAIKFGALVELVFSELDIAPAGSPYAAARAVSDSPRGKGTAGPGTRRVKFGVIGAGSAWGFHSAACAGSPYLQFVAVYDKNQKLAEKVAKRYKVNTMEAYSDLGEFLKSDIEAVLIMVPHVYHADIVSKVAAAKKHILCEKPMATTLEDCDRMIQAAKKAGVKLMIAENHRFLPAHQYVHDAIRKGLIGDVLLVRAYEGVNEIEGMTAPDFWKGDPIRAGGGSFMDMGAHKFATLQWVLEDEVESVTALLAKQATNLPEKAEDNALSMLRFSGGAVGEVVVSFTQMTPPFNSMEIHGTRGTILENHMWDRPVRVFSSHDDMGENKNQWFEPEIEHAPFPLYYNISARNEDEYFAQCILENKDPEFTPEQAKSAIAAVLMGYLSAETGKAASRDDLSAVAKTAGTKSILEALADHIPVNKQLPEVKRMNPIGFSRPRIRQIMDKRDLDILIVTSPVNVFYASGMPTLHASPNPILFALSNQYPTVAMVNRDGDCALFNWALFQSVDRFSWIADHRGTIGLKETCRAITAKIKKWGMEGKRIGMESLAPKYILDHLLRQKASPEIVTADDVLLDMRLVKSDEEIRRIEIATRITERAITACMKAAKEGMTDNDFLKLARKTMIDEGAEVWDHLTLSIGDSDPEAPGIGTVLKKGDIARFDFGAVYQGYVADVNRHVVLGPVPKGAAESIDRLIMLQEYYEQRVKPGVNIKELNAEASAFYLSKRQQGMTFAVGHSIGLECEEQHLFGPLSVLDRPFEQNMVFEIEAWEPYETTLIGVEDCYVVTADGCRKITTLDKHIISV
jgi:predicted dehydrogenase/Xaa-Pro aminopeptidase/putative sterol carrier protein